MTIGRPIPTLSVVMVAAVVALLVLFYVAYVGSHALYQDNVTLTFSLVRPCLDQGGSWAMFWAPHNGIHRIPGEKILTMLNVRYFGWDPKLELYLGVIWIFGVALALGAWLRWAIVDARPYVMAIVSMFFIAVVSVLTPWENYVFNGGTYHVLQSALYAWGAYLFARLLDTGRRDWYSLFIVTSFFSSVVVTSMYSIAFAAAVMLVAGLCMFRRRLRWISLGVVLLQLTWICVYFVGLDLPPSSLGNWGVRLQVFFNSMISPVLHNEQICAHLPSWGAFVLGGAFFFLYLLGILVSLNRIFRCNDMRFIMPLVLIFHVLAVAAMIMLGRTEGGGASGFASRYTSQGVLGVGSLVGIAVFFVSDKASMAVVRALLWFGLSTITACCVYSTCLEWQLARSRVAYYAELAQITLAPECFSASAVARFQSDQSAARVWEAVGFWKKHRLGVFRQAEPAAASDRIRPIRGFLALEGQADNTWRWLEREAIFEYSTNEKAGTVTITGEVFSPEGPSCISLIINGTIVQTAHVGVGVFVLNGALARDSINRIVIRADRAEPVVPGGDVRERAFVLRRVQCVTAEDIY